MPSPEGYNQDLPENINDHNEAHEINEMVDDGLISRKEAEEISQVDGKYLLTHPEIMKECLEELTGLKNLLDQPFWRNLVRASKTIFQGVENPEQAKSIVESAAQIARGKVVDLHSTSCYFHATDDKALWQIMRTGLASAVYSPPSKYPYANFTHDSGGIQQSKRPLYLENGALTTHKNNSGATQVSFNRLISLYSKSQGPGEILNPKHRGFKTHSEFPRIMLDDSVESILVGGDLGGLWQDEILAIDRIPTKFVNGLVCSESGVAIDWDQIIGKVRGFRRESLPYMEKLLRYLEPLKAEMTTKAQDYYDESVTQLFGEEVPPDFSSRYMLPKGNSEHVNQDTEKSFRFIPSFFKRFEDIPEMEPVKKCFEKWGLYHIEHIDQFMQSTDRNEYLRKKVGPEIYRAICESGLKAKYDEYLDQYDRTEWLSNNINIDAQFMFPPEDETARKVMAMCYENYKGLAKLLDTINTVRASLSSLPNDEILEKLELPGSTYTVAGMLLQSPVYDTDGTILWPTEDDAAKENSWEELSPQK